MNIILPPLPELPLYKFPCRKFGWYSGTKVKMPFELPFCRCFKIILCIVQIRLAMT